VKANNFENMIKKDFFQKTYLENASQFHQFNKNIDYQNELSNLFNF
jgi:hypothetical protein